VTRHGAWIALGFGTVVGVLAAAPAWAQPTAAADTAPASLAAPRGQAPESDWTMDSEDRRFRVGFDLARCFALGLAWAPRTVGGDPSLDRIELDTGLRYRHAIDFPVEGVRYKLYHEVLVSHAALTSPQEAHLESTLSQFRFMRYSRDGRVVLPSSPPESLPFPLNIGFEATLGSVDFAEAGPGYGAEIRVARVEVVLDFWQRRELGSYAQLGVGPWYSVWLFGADEPVVDHLVAPFTSGSLVVHHELDQGKHVLEAEVRGGYALSTSSGSAAHALVRASYEAVLLAINDLPVSASATAHYRFEQAPRPSAGPHEIGASLGVRLGVPLGD
jgi:hypothetical protein